MGAQNIHHREIEISQIIECTRSQAPLEPVETVSSTGDSPQTETDKNN